MSEWSGSQASRLLVMWILLSGFLVTAIGATAIAVIVAQPERAGGVNEWLLLAIIVGAAAAALTVLRRRWFTKVPPDPGLAVTTGVVMRLAVVELVWIAAFLFYFLGLVGPAVLYASVGAAVVLALLYLAPTSRLVDELQEQFDSVGGIGDVGEELRRPLQR